MILQDLYKCEPFNIPAAALVRLNFLVPRLSKVEEAYGQYLWVTSGFRTISEHTAIYKKINEERKLAKKKLVPIPMHSKHLSGDAADVEDKDGALKVWIANHLHVIEDAQLYMEAFKYCDGWVHFQQIAPASGNRFFNPY